MPSKEFVLFSALSGSVSHERRRVEDIALIVHSTLVANGFIPSDIQPGTQSGHVSLIPAEWPSSSPNLFTFTYMDNVEVKCVPVGSTRLAVHATDHRGKIFSIHIDYDESVPLDAEKLISFIKSNLLNVLVTADTSTPPHPPTSEEERRVFVMEQGHRGGPPSYEPPRAPPFGTPIGPGELVGPEHPIFTGQGQTGEGRQRGVRDPRFDPIGPGYIGEPDTDHFPPPPFGEPPGGRRPPGRAPLRGPHANIGPGGMFM